VRDVGEAISMPHLASRGVRLPLKIDGMPEGRDDVSIVNAGFVMQQDGPHVDAQPPRLGEHSAQIRAWLQQAALR